MIGDWVTCKKWGENPYRLTRINSNGKYYRGVTGNGSQDGLFFIEEIEPIPITPEILEKNGFEKVLDKDGTECYRYYNRAADGYIKISLYKGGDGDWSIEIINYEKFDDNEIVYNNNFIFLKVHQLQHLFRLCGINKEIEL